MRNLLIFLALAGLVLGQVLVPGGGSGAGGSSSSTDNIPVVTAAAGTATAATGTVRLGNTEGTLTTTCTITPTAGTGTARFYMNSNLTFTWGHNVTATGAGAGCTAVAAAVSAFPADSYPISVCTVTAGALTSCTAAAKIGRDVIVAGTGLSESTTNGVKTLTYTAAPIVGSGSGFLANFQIQPGAGALVSTGALVGSANLTRCGQMLVPPSGALVNRLSYQVTTGAGGGGLRVVFWTIDGATRLVDSGAITGTDITGTGWKTISFSEVQLDPGWIYYSYTSDDTTLAMSALSSSGANAWDDIYTFFNSATFGTARGGNCTASTGSAGSINMGATLGAPANAALIRPALFMLWHN